ncbi:MAG: hypothetical protein FWE37_08250, partial [Spirochaetaceae bacterium]|nr:hypothetical protein [Spirochaetaceae bacterium]
MPIKTNDFFTTAYTIAGKHDPRGEAGIKRLKDKAQKAYEALKTAEERARFDKDRLEHPYADCRIIYDSGQPIQKIMVGIDCLGDELLLADRLNRRGENIDMVLSHHPQAQGTPGLAYVVASQTDLLAGAGVPVSQVEIPMQKRAAEVGRGLAPGNHQRPEAVARLLNISYGCLHSAADLLVQAFLQKRFNAANHETVDDIIKDLLTLPEYRQAAINGTLPTVMSGGKDNRAG